MLQRVAKRLKHSSCNLVSHGIWIKSEINSNKVCQASVTARLYRRDGITRKFDEEISKSPDVIAACQNWLSSTMLFNWSFASDTGTVKDAAMAASDPIPHSSNLPSMERLQSKTELKCKRQSCPLEKQHL